ncbi:hypothetical protein [Parasphingorhabdus pacifica]
MFEAILAVFLTGLTFIVLMHLPEFLEVLVERLRLHEDVTVAQQVAAEDDDKEN